MHAQSLANGFEDVRGILVKYPLRRLFLGPISPSDSSSQHCALSYRPSWMGEFGITLCLGVRAAALGDTGWYLRLGLSAREGRRKGAVYW